MASVTITIEDLPNSKVKVVSTPSCELMIAMKASGTSLTAAHGYAFLALNAIQKESRNQRGPRISMPR